jgi:putative endonuclease
LTEHTTKAPLAENSPESIAEASSASQQPWFVYLVRMQSGALYTGISTEPERRLRQHQGALVGGAKALRGKGPLNLVWQLSAKNKSHASRLEYQIKQLSKAKKEALITGEWMLPQPLDIN